MSCILLYSQQNSVSFFIGLEIPCFRLTLLLHYSCQPRILFRKWISSHKICTYNNCCVTGQTPHCAILSLLECVLTLNWLTKLRSIDCVYNWSGNQWNGFLGIKLQFPPGSITKQIFPVICLSGEMFSGSKDLQQPLILYCSLNLVWLASKHFSIEVLTSPFLQLFSFPLSFLYFVWNKYSNTLRKIYLANDFWSLPWAQ